MFDWWDRGQDFRRDMWQAKMSLGDIWLRVQRLPPGSAVSRKVNPEQWFAEHYILADLYDSNAAGNWQRGGDKHAKRPDPYPRPAVERAKQQRGAQMIRDELARQARLKKRG